VNSQKETFQGRIQVLLPVPLDNSFDYTTEQPLCLGDFVQVPFGKKKLWGVVWSQQAVFESNVKTVIAKSTLPPLSDLMRQYIEWVADYIVAPRGAVLKMVMNLPAVFNEPKRARKKFQFSNNFSYRSPDLSEDQERVVVEIKQYINAQPYSVSLIDGVTGSGKTEVYFEIIAEKLSDGGQVLILLPEISLGPQWFQRFKERFGVEPAQWHSDLTPAQRRETWLAIQRGEAQVVVGARSALFLPYANLKMIVVDEEHEQAFKQEEGVIYHARDMAIARAHMEQIPILLASATPSLETIDNCERHRYKRFYLPERFGDACFPSITTVDMRTEGTRGNHNWLSSTLSEAIKQTVERSEQVLLFLNRRGYAPLTLCRKCGARVTCPHCTAWLVEHKKPPRMECHHCGHTANILKSCDACSAEEDFVACGPGVERLEEEIKKRFPNLRCLIMASDRVTTSKMLNEAIAKIQQHEVDIVIGTQMMAKGHHFPKLTLVGVIDADLGLAGGDLRASEKTFQLLHQVSGRAGRAEYKGSVVIQTYQPEHPVMQALLEHDRDKFIAFEQESRKLFHMPPYGRLVAVVFSGTDGLLVERTARSFVLKAPLHDQFEILGPARAPLAVIRGRHRWRILIKGPKELSVQKLLKFWLKGFDCPASIKLSIDVDPYSFL
jgi:primosomal protein N' (replication factor Y)